MDDIFKQMPELQELLEKTAQQEVLGKIPELLDTLLKKVLEQENISEDIKRREARDRLITQLAQITEQMGRLVQKKGERLSEEQVKEVLSEVPRTMPKNISWAFVPSKK